MIAAATSPSRVDYSIYEGWRCAGAVRHVFSRGSQVVADGRVVAPAGHGRFATQGADRVLVLDRGRLVEDGEPDAVAARSALFRSLIAQ